LSPAFVVAKLPDDPTAPTAGEVAPALFSWRDIMDMLKSLAALLRLWSSMRFALASLLSLSAMQNLLFALILWPCQRKTKGITHMSSEIPPSREQAPEIPRASNMGRVARGKTVAKSEREHDAAALADAA
jgi:hypothetical protein